MAKYPLTESRVSLSASTRIRGMHWKGGNYRSPCLIECLGRSSGGRLVGEEEWIVRLVQRMYANAQSPVCVGEEYSEEFEV